MSRIWITWEFQRRNIGISSALGWQLVQIEIRAPRIKRYVLSLWKTFSVVMAKRPDVMTAQNPSIVLAVFSVIIARIIGSKIIIDAHNSGIYPAEGRSVFLTAVANWIQKKADLVIVTNEILKEVVESHGGRSFVLPDKISTLPAKIEHVELEGNINVAFICTYSDDEPYREVIKAASLLRNDIVFYFTGRFQGKVDPKDVPANVKLLGFVSEDRYWSLLRSADIVMDLTLRDDCLVCGAYEAVALGKPLVLSNTKALRSYFNIGCVYVDPTVQSIVDGILESVTAIGALQRDAITLRANLEAGWALRFAELTHEINRIVPNPKSRGYGL